ncbi:MAG: S8 family serine peptidase [Ginsengibacter sp.]
MKRNYLFFLFVFFFSEMTTAQYSRYIISFGDKTKTPFSVNDPSKFLSPKAIKRRIKQSIAVDETDLPIVPRYVDSIRSSGNVAIIDYSKWFNQVCIETTDAAALAKISKLPFVVNALPVKRFMRQNVIEKNKFNEQINNIATTLSPEPPGNYYTYGNSFDQIHIHKGEYLHNKGFRGEGMLIAIIDAGFYHYKTLPVFDSVRHNKQIIETYDFVNNEISVDEDNYHGMMCFSIMAADIPNQLVGSSPKADYLLYRSEDVSSESPVEEQYWIAAAERADSIGADIISTSLGYNTFDNPTFNYTYDDMNGHTTLIAKAATLAAKKGMIVAAAAGNEGNNPWHFISTPGDADSVLTVGAVDGTGTVAGFSSYGPSSDGRIKPTVASVGAGTAISSVTGQVETGDGTSFASPNLAGLVACLWQAFPELTNMEIIDAIKKNSSIYKTPNDRMGYGIPDFQTTYDSLDQQRTLRNAIKILGNNKIKIYPNPFKNKFIFLINPEHTAIATFGLYDAGGRLYLEKQVSLQEGVPEIVSFDNFKQLQSGVYILNFSDGISSQSFKIISN